MPISRSVNETIAARLRRDPAFRDEVFREGVECLLAGDMNTGKAILRDYISVTIGFKELGGATGKPVKSLMRMLSPMGNPQARKLLDVIAQLQRVGGLRLELSVKGSGI
jgi:RecA-family ATPase